MPLLSLHDISFDMEFATRESREATFPPPNKRSKSGWPHKTPTAKDLARAGFYFRPSPHSNDNTVCFLCDRNLDGWEAEDDPVLEHLKHAEDCGWAVLMNIEACKEQDVAIIEDPTGQKITDARRATFAAGWPHEGKRGWTCKTEKMVEAGWYFAPTSGSEDYVSCAYCKLSLDGWEPKDNPFEEHYSRSPNCPFFVFAGTTAPSKRPKAKKGRASRASRTSKASTRLSTQSNITIQSDPSSIPDLDESIDTSAVSILSTTSTATTKGKRKATTSKGKTAKPKRTKTTKPEKIVQTEPVQELGLNSELVQDQITLGKVASENVLYSQLQQQAEHQSQEAILVTDEETSKPESDVDNVGPPRIPTPTIPVLTQSPIHSGPKEQRLRTPPIISVKRTEANLIASPTRSSPSQPSDVENAPPSSRPKAVQPPSLAQGTIHPAWDAVDVDIVFGCISSIETSDKFNEKEMTDTQKQMTVQEWIQHLAEKAEGDLRLEGERMVGLFEKEGQRALTVLERIACV